MSRKKTTYTIEGETQCKLIMVPTGSTVGEFLTLIKNRAKDPSLVHVYLEGDAVDLEDDFADYWSEDVVFVCSPRAVPPSGDWIGPLLLSRSASRVPAFATAPLPPPRPPLPRAPASFRTRPAA
jgi:hypothetical protein